MNQLYHIGKNLCGYLGGKIILRILHLSKHASPATLPSKVQRKLTSQVIFSLFFFGSIKRNSLLSSGSWIFCLFNSEFISQVIQHCFFSEGRDLFLWIVILSIYNCLSAELSLGCGEPKDLEFFANTLSSYSTCSKWQSVMFFCNWCNMFPMVNAPMGGQLPFTSAVFQRRDMINYVVRGGSVKAPWDYCLNWT